MPLLHVVIGPMMMRVTPRQTLGRTSGMIAPVASGANLAGATVGGGLYTLLGASIALGPIGDADTLRVLIVGCGLLLLVAAVVVHHRLDHPAARDEYERAAGTRSPE